jgi:hypothetical protein
MKFENIKNHRVSKDKKGITMIMIPKNAMSSLCWTWKEKQIDHKKLGVSLCNAYYKLIKVWE